MHILKVESGSFIPELDAIFRDIEKQDETKT